MNDATPNDEGYSMLVEDLDGTPAGVLDVAELDSQAEITATKSAGSSAVPGSAAIFIKNALERTTAPPLHLLFTLCLVLADEVLAPLLAAAAEGGTDLRPDYLERAAQLIADGP